MAEAFLNTLLKTRNSITARGEECCICLEEHPTEPLIRFDREPCIRLPCSHIVHIDCIAKWILCRANGPSTCPICRHTLFTTTTTTATAADVSPSSTTEAAARRELQLFYGTGQLLQRACNGHPDLYDEGQTYVERLNPADWPLTNPKQFFARRMRIGNINDPPRSTTDAMVRRHRNIVEVATYRRLREWDPRMPPLDSHAQLDCINMEAMYNALRKLGVFEEMWGPWVPNLDLPSPFDMFTLIRDSGFAYQWREGSSHCCFRRCGLRRPGRERSTQSLSPEARALLEREPLPDRAPLREARRDERRGRTNRSEFSAVVAPLDMRQPSSARRVVQWYRRHWWRGGASRS